MIPEPTVTCNQERLLEMLVEGLAGADVDGSMSRRARDLVTALAESLIDDDPAPLVDLVGYLASCGSRPVARSTPSS